MNRRRCSVSGSGGFPKEIGSLKPQLADRVRNPVCLVLRAALATFARMAIEIVPSIDLRGGKVVRLKQGDYERQLDYDLDPITAAKRFRDDGARWLHIVDL